MPRRVRLNLPNFPKHIVHWGHNNQPTFFKDADYKFYLECLKDAAQRNHCDVHAYVLMGNHVHLLVTPKMADGVGRMMQMIGRRYVQHVNAAYARSGTLWEGRYRAAVIQPEKYLIACQRHMEWDPVRANLVDNPIDYQWSSCGHYATGIADEIVHPHPQSDLLGVSPVERQRAYLEEMRKELDHSLAEEIRIVTKRGLVLGDPAFKMSVEQIVSRRVMPQKHGRPTKGDGITYAVSAPAMSLQAQESSSTLE